MRRLTQFEPENINCLSHYGQISGNQFEMARKVQEKHVRRNQEFLLLSAYIFSRAKRGVEFERDS